MSTVEKTGKTVEEALQEALKELNLRHLTYREFYNPTGVPHLLLSRLKFYFSKTIFLILLNSPAYIL